jgi:two-component system, NtrC family, response regulator AtoC
MASQADILVVDDDPAVGKVVAALLTQAGFAGVWVGSAEVALQYLEKHAVDAIISDIRMPGLDGMALLKAVKQRWPEVPVVLLSAHGTVALAVEAMRDGAADFLQKPFDRDEVLFVVKKVLSTTEVVRAQPPVAPAARNDDGMVGTSESLAQVKQLIAAAAQSAATVLVLGETGTGKELVAKAIHQQSARAKKPFVRVNVGALPDTLFESELFGYEKGAFTGAVSRKPGRVELAEGGTLFLDEVGELQALAQVKLLRLLQEKEFERLGGTETLKANVRVIAATHRDLPALVRSGQFREDLLYRLNVVPITLPPLRARASDVPALAVHFVAHQATLNARPGLALSTDALEVLAAQPWPGNVRQLQNFIERLVVLSVGATLLTKADVERELGRAGAIAPAVEIRGELSTARTGAERAAVEEALRQAQGNRSLAARLLGVSRRTLYNKLEALGLG